LQKIKIGKFFSDKEIKISKDEREKEKRVKKNPQTRSNPLDFPTNRGRKIGY